MPVPTARVAVAFSFAAKYSTLALRTVGLLVLARLLPPEEFGVFATAAAIVTLVFVFAEFGLHSHLIQARRLTRALVAAALGLAGVLNLVAITLIVALAWLLPWTQTVPEASTVLLLLAVAAAAGPVALPVAAKLQRGMRFDRLLVIDFTRSMVGVGGSIALVATGWGVVGLAWAAVAESVSGVALTLALGAGRRPVLPALRGWGTALRFGGPLALVGGFRQAAEAGTTLLISSLLGLAAAGIYARALTVKTLLNKAVVEAVSPVVLPVLARETRQGRDLGGLYLRKIGALTALHWPFFAVLALLAEPLVLLVLGPQWAAAAPVVRVLALAGLFDPFGALSLKFFVALGANGAFLRIQACVVAARLLAVGLLAMVSLEAAAIGLVAGAAVRAVGATLWLERRLGVSWAAIGRRVGQAALLTGFSVVGPAFLLLVTGWPADLAVGLAGGALGALGWAAGLAVTRHELGGELLRAAAALRGRLAAWITFHHRLSWRR
ncbi:MAG TPA: oligosaccharide flippase family protein [Falsiroseomonas sp.]|nr:oligosaccharide flippase family protein [Falsiroseomonas sp.]